MKKKFSKIILITLLILVLPVSMVLAGFCLPKQFDESYYGEIAEVYHKIKETDGKRIIFIGNSAVAFGIRPDLVESEISGYKSINFGIYGAVGTKFMLDLSKAELHEGDVIVIMPELYTQTCSLYYSAKDAWRAFDSDFSMLKYVAKENREALVGNYVAYTAEKVRYAKGEGEPLAEGAYTKSAFVSASGKNEGYIVYYRPYNVMAGGYNAVNLPVVDKSVFGTGFIDYLNDYAKFAKKKGAAVYFGFAPLNTLALEDDAEDKCDELFDYLEEALDFGVLGHPSQVLLDYHWFYDNNVHMNSSGAVKYTDIMVGALKTELKIYTQNNIVIPEMPEIPEQSAGTGDNSDAGYFTYELKTGATGDYIRLTGLTEEGKTRTSLKVPSDYNGVRVREFAVEVFQNNDSLAKVVIPKNVSTVYDDSFYGATRLAAIYFEHDYIQEINIGEGMLNGTKDSCYIYVKEGFDYNAGCEGGWQMYGNRIRTY